jgi:hypothetical protein
MKRSNRSGRFCGDLKSCGLCGNKQNPLTICGNEGQLLNPFGPLGG